jgi:hypothetical protein
VCGPTWITGSVIHGLKFGQILMDGSKMEARLISLQSG